ncbi:hypothetical protein [Tsukamurella soli]|uniref:hypothetical protein n=1 Tax=Tsukamurella soli TaxID=644556 RepID=UPI0031EB40E9
MIVVGEYGLEANTVASVLEAARDRSVRGLPPYTPSELAAMLEPPDPGFYRGMCLGAAKVRMVFLHGKSGGVGDDVGRNWPTG